MDIQQDIKALKERRKLSKITARELYEAAGLTCTRYAAIEGGHDLPTNQEWHAIDTAFYRLDAQRATDEGKWLLSGTREQTDARRKVARWNAAARPIDDGDDGLLTCSVCRDRYTTDPGGVCDQCKQQAWLDKNA